MSISGGPRVTSGNRTTEIERLLPTLVWTETNLAADLSLAALARVQGLSPQHFHRVFRSATGETPRRYVQRLRLDRGAFLLAIGHRTVLEVALDIGFRNHETFTRAFKRQFGKTPTAYRRTWQDGDTSRPDRRRPGLEERIVAGGELSDVRVRTLVDVHVAFIRHLGDYETVPPSLWDELAEWYRQAGHDGRARLIGIGHDAPGITPAAKLRFDACVQVPEPFTPSDGVGCSVIPGGDYAMATHVGPYRTLSAAWAEFFRRVTAMKRYRTLGLPAVEMYDATQITPEFALNRTELCMPVTGPGG